MKLKSLAFFISTIFFAFLALAVQTHAQTNQDQITLFDVPGASGGTFPRSINAKGEVTGYYFAGSTYHGFVRGPDGTITTFDASVGGTMPVSINPRGEITGAYQDANGVHGFVRASTESSQRSTQDPMAARH
jgi:hypothetical protein